MKLLEYQAKEVLASLGIPIPPGKVARTPEEAAAACSELGPVAVKAQVPVGGRGKAGGVKLAKTPAQGARAAGAAHRDDPRRGARGRGSDHRNGHQGIQGSARVLRGGARDRARDLSRLHSGSRCA